MSGWKTTSQSTSSLLRRAFSFYATLTPPHQAGGSGLKQTSDIQAAKTAADAAIPLTQKGAASGVAPLDGTAKVPDANLPSSLARDTEVPGLVGAAITAGDTAVTGPLSATYVRFVDEDGDPFPGDRLVTISVDSTTGEIIDILSEAV